MSGSAVFLPPFPTAKRSACDRCRAQKLRCPPRERATDSCHRCTRLGLNCTTSYAKPGGRGPKTGLVAATSSRDHELKSRGDNGGEAKATSESSAARQDTQPSNNQPSQPSQMTDVTMADPFSFVIPGLPDDALPTFYGDQYDVTDSDFPFELSNIALPPLPTPGPGLAGLGLEGTEEGNIEDRSKEAQHPEGGASGSSADTCGNEYRLARLNVQVSKQIEQYNLADPCLPEPQSHSQQSWDSPMPDGGSDAAELSKAGQSDGSLTSRLLGDALGDTSELIAILQSYAPERRGSISSISSRTSEKGVVDTASGSPRFGLVVALNLLSVYTQLIVVYDKLFHNLSAQLLDASPGPEGGSENSLSGLQLAGFPAPRGDWQIKILVHGILHQFETIERALGLPIEFRVTDKRDTHPGLFEGGLVRSLLEAVSSGQGTHDTHDGTGNHQGIDALHAVLSLREGLARVQKYLNM